jgi:hypothetical protein
VARASPPIEAPAVEAQTAPPAAAATTPAAGERGLRLAVGACLGAVATFFALRLSAWAPHEDETLELYVGHESLPALLETVLGERGGAPLHFLFAWAVTHLGGGLHELRLVSAAFALASIPLVAALAVRLADRTIAVLATALASASWMLLFHGIYARMYSLFLFTSALSYVALLAALRTGGGRRWALWVAAVLLTVATHPYGALVLASQVVFVAVTRQRLREAALATAAVAVLGTPFWITDVVLAGRFDVGVGGGGQKLGGPLPVLAYLGDVAEDFSAGPAVLPVVLGLAALGAGALARASRSSVLLVACAFGTPTAAFLLARLGNTAAPETRHLIFTLPFFVTLLATGVVALARSRRADAERVAGITAALLVVGAAVWAWDKTPTLFEGEPGFHAEARDAAGRWLATTGRPDDVLLGYEPLWLEAWERSASFSRRVLPRADAKLALAALREAPHPLGRGVWVLDAADAVVDEGDAIHLRLPRPAAAFEARAFGPYLVLRTREPTRTPKVYLQRAAAAMVLAKTLAIRDADVNFATVGRATELYASSSSRSSSSSSR